MSKFRPEEEYGDIETLNPKNTLSKQTHESDILPLPLPETVYIEREYPNDSRSNLLIWTDLEDPELVEELDPGEKVRIGVYKLVKYVNIKHVSEIIIEEE